MLVDCGATSLTALKAQGLDPNNVGAVAVTHLHGDHFAGLPFLILDGQFSRRTSPLLVAGPPGIRARLTEAMETLFPGSSRAARRFPVEVTELKTDGTPAGLDGNAKAYQVRQVLDASLSWLAPTPVEALAGLADVVRDRDNSPDSRAKGLQHGGP